MMSVDRRIPWLVDRIQYCQPPFHETLKSEGAESHTPYFLPPVTSPRRFEGLIGLLQLAVNLLISIIFIFCLTNIASPRYSFNKKANLPQAPATCFVPFWFSSWSPLHSPAFFHLLRICYNNNGIRYKLKTNFCAYFLSISSSQNERHHLPTLLRSLFCSLYEKRLQFTSPACYNFGIWISAL